MTDDIYPDWLAKAICTRAILEGRCAELLNVLSAGGAATVDPIDKILELASAEQLAGLHVVTIDRDLCETCDGTGYLLDQGYGDAAEPGPDWIPVQRCDTCDTVETDHLAAAKAAEASGHTAEEPRYVDRDEDGMEVPGDWFIRKPAPEGNHS